MPSSAVPNRCWLWGKTVFIPSLLCYYSINPFGQPSPPSFEDCFVSWTKHARIILIAAIPLCPPFHHQTFAHHSPATIYFSRNWSTFSSQTQDALSYHLACAHATTPCLTSLSPLCLLCTHIFSLQNSNQTWVIMCSLYSDWYYNSEHTIWKQKSC